MKKDNLKFWICLAAVSFLISCQTKTAKQNEIDNNQSEVEDILKNEVENSFDPKEHPLILRRTTLVVRDIEKSLALYQDAIGMEVIYDNIIRRPHKTEEGEEEIRLVFLKANNSYYGVLGLLEYEYNKTDKVSPPHKTRGVCRSKFHIAIQYHRIGCEI